MAFVVLMNADERGTKKKLKELAKQHKLELPLTYNIDRQTAQRFKLSERVKYTVLVYEKKRVISNFALNKIGMKELKEITASVKRVFKGQRLKGG